MFTNGIRTFEGSKTSPAPIALIKHPTFTELPDALRFHAIAIAALIQHYGGCIPCSAEWIANELHATTEIELNVLIEIGLFAKVVLTDIQEKSFARIEPELLKTGDLFDEQMSTNLDSTKRDRSIRSANKKVATQSTTIVERTTDSNAVAIVEIFEYWKKLLRNDDKRVRLTPKITGKIRARLADGFTAVELKAAIEGCTVSDWHMGRCTETNGAKYDTIDLIFRDGEKVRAFIGYLETAKQRGNVPTRPAKETHDNTMEVFSHWSALHGTEQNAGHVLTQEGRTLIERRMNEGFSVSQLKDAVTGLSLSPWHMGENPSGVKHNTLADVFGTGEKVRGAMQVYAASSGKLPDGITRQTDGQSESINAHLMSLLTRSQSTNAQSLH